jgi:hypothetical protein
MFDLRSRKELPYSEEWFRVPPHAPHGQTPKLGVLPGLREFAQSPQPAPGSAGPPSRDSHPYG